MLRMLKTAALVAVVLLVTGSVATAQNLLTNPGFESGLDGWGFWGNTYAEVTNAPQFVPYEGNGLVSFFGNWSGPYNVSGFFQEFPTVPGDEWTMSAKSRHWSGDPMIGAGAPDGNWVVQKLAWFDAGNAEIGGVESTILDGTFAQDMWFDNAPIVGVAPAGAVKVQALLLYIQPATDGGAAQIDMVTLTKSGAVPVEESTWGKVKALYE